MGNVTGVSKADIDYKKSLDAQLATAKYDLQTLYDAHNMLLARGVDTTSVKNEIQLKLDEIRGLNDELQTL